jgi:hypothetical protein
LRLLWQSKIEFVFYFADEAQAQPVVAYLKRKGFKVESTLSGDASWFRQVSPPHRVAPSYSRISLSLSSPAIAGEVARLRVRSTKRRGGGGRGAPRAVILGSHEVV